MEKSLYSTAKWLSNDYLRLIEIIHCDTQSVIYKNIITDKNILQKDTRIDFIKYYSPVTLDTSLYKGIPIKYKGPKIDNYIFNSKINFM
tara:strand:- start:988 stop:1254 length:267 start_codon:yes stop_codon:yes gene_type:complete